MERVEGMKAVVGFNDSSGGCELRRLNLLRRMALWCAICVLAVASLSAFIRLSNAGLGCADWPQCYGQNLRTVQQGGELRTSSEGGGVIAARMVHRIVAVAVLVIILVMLYEGVSARSVLRQEVVMVSGLLLLALFLAVLGRWSSSARIPAVTIGNLLGGFLMLALCWRLRLQVSARLEALHGIVGATVGPSIGVRMAAWFCAAVLLGQIALGGLVSGSYSGLGCQAVQECVPSAGSVAGMALSDVLDPWREPVLVATSPGNPNGAAIQQAHRLGAGVVVAAVLMLGLLALRNGRRREGLILLVLLATQIGLGILLVVLSLPMWAAMAHNLVAALLLMAVFSLL